jgi:hypothetical protein
LLRRLAILTLILTSPALLAAPPAVVVTLDSQDQGRVFDGIGAVSGGGGVARLLVNYPEPQRSQILDFLFRPNYGASLHALKVEIGGDGNSTEGSEPSHMHSAGDENYSRGFEWWIMKEAKRRNPNIQLSALAWDFPGWLKEADSQAAADYLVKFLEGNKKVHGLDIDYIGIWNETKMPYEFIKTLRRTLLAHGLKTRLIADDLVNTWAIAETLEKDPELRDAIDVVSTHYPHFQSTPVARGVGKPIWSTEDGPWGDSWATAGRQSGPYAEVLNRNYIEGRMTSTMLWCLTSSYYDILDVPYAGLLRADAPWSGHFQPMTPLWIVAHTTQFAQPGWQYLDRATGMLPDGGSYVSLKKGREYSVIVETLAATQPQTLDISIRGDLSRGKVYVWRTNRAKSFERIAEIKPKEGKFSFQLDPSSVYSLTTTTGQHKGTAVAPPARLFPIPYRDDFEEYPIGYTTPKYFIEQNGAYEVTPCGGNRGGHCLRQVVNQVPIVWTYGKTADRLGTASLIGDKRWANYAVSADVLFEEPGYGRVMGRVSRATLDGDISGYQLYFYDNGKWELRSATKDGILDSGQVTCSLNTWHHLELKFRDDLISAAIDGRMVAGIKDTKYAAGMAGIGNGFNIGQYDDFEVRPLAGSTLVTRPLPPAQSAPPKPELFVPTPLDQSVRLTWTTVEGATGYRVWIGNRKGEYQPAVDVGALASYKVTTLTNGQIYYFVVSAYDSKGEGPISNEMSATPERRGEECARARISAYAARNAFHATSPSALCASNAR